MSAPAAYSQCFTVEKTLNEILWDTTTERLTLGRFFNSILDDSKIKEIFDKNAEKIGIQIRSINKKVESVLKQVSDDPGFNSRFKQKVTQLVQRLLDTHSLFSSDVSPENYHALVESYRTLQRELCLYSNVMNYSTKEVNAIAQSINSEEEVHQVVQRMVHKVATEEEKRIASLKKQLELEEKQAALKEQATIAAEKFAQEKARIAQETEQKRESEKLRVRIDAMKAIIEKTKSLEIPSSNPQNRAVLSKQIDKIVAAFSAMSTKMLLHLSDSQRKQNLAKFINYLEIENKQRNTLLSLYNKEYSKKKHSKNEKKETLDLLSQSEQDTLKRASILSKVMRTYAESQLQLNEPSASSFSASSAIV